MPKQIKCGISKPRSIPSRDRELRLQQQRHKLWLLLRLPKLPRLKRMQLKKLLKQQQRKNVKRRNKLKNWLKKPWLRD
jgi:hypothetical protein